MEKTISIKELADSFEKSEFYIVAGEKGANNTISQVAVLDAMDGPDYLKGNELILSSTYIFRDSIEDLVQFVKDLKDVHASGLCIKQNRYLDDVPQELIDFGNANDFPIILISNKFVWSDIITRFYKLSFFSDDKNETISQAMSKSIKKLDYYGKEYKKSISEFSDIISRDLKVNVFILNKSGQVLEKHLSNGMDSEEEKAIKNILNQMVPDRRINSIYNYDRTYKNNDYYFLIHKYQDNNEDGLILVIGDNVSYIDTFKKILNFISKESHFQKDESDYFYHNKLDSLLYKLITSQLTKKEANEFYIENHELFLDDNMFYTVIYLKGQDLEKTIKDIDLYTKSIVSKESRLKYNAVYENTGNDSAILLLSLVKNLPEKQINAQIEVKKAFNEIEKNKVINDKVQIYLGRTYAEFQDIIDSYKESKIIESLNYILQDYTNVFFYDEVSLLYYSMDLDNKEAFFDIEVLSNAKEELGFNGVETLILFLVHGSYKVTSEKLYIHENTLRYRIKKIENLLGIDTRKPYIRHIYFMKLSYWITRNKKSN